MAMTKEPRPRPVAKTKEARVGGMAVKATNAVRICGPQGEKSVEIRKISNGFVVRESTWGPGGKYKSTETFSANAPSVQLSAPKK